VYVTKHRVAAALKKDMARGWSGRWRRD